MSLDDDPKSIVEVVPKLSGILAEKLRVHTLLASKGEEPDFSDQQLNFFCGYITAYSDILAQSAGGESGGSVAISIAVSALQNLFGDEPGKRLFGLIDRYMSTPDRPSEFDEGLTGGAEDAIEWINQKQSYGIGKHFIAFFQLSEDV